MKTIRSDERNAIESEIIGTLLNNPSYFDQFSMDEKMFQNPHCIRLFKKIEAHKVAKKKIDLIEFMNDEELSEIRQIFQKDYGIYTSIDFGRSLEKLQEDNKRHAINRSTDHSADSTELFAEVEKLKDLQDVFNLESFEEHIKKYRENYIKTQEAIKTHGAIGLFTSWKKFNEMVGATPGDLVVIGARTSIGKTTFSLNVAVEAAFFDQKVLFVSMEMPRERIFDKILAMTTKRENWKFKYTKFTLSELDSSLKELESIKNNFCFIESPQCTSKNLMRLTKAYKPDIVVVDYLQLLRDESRKGETENNRLGRVSGNLKAIAGENRCIVIAPAQLNRDSEKSKREPFLADLRDSGCIEQDADTVLLLHRPERESTMCKLIIAKNRNGALGTIDFNFNPEWSWFEEDDL